MIAWQTHTSPSIIQLNEDELKLFNFSGISLEMQIAGDPTLELGHNKKWACPTVAILI